MRRAGILLVALFLIWSCKSAPVESGREAGLPPAPDSETALRLSPAEPLPPAAAEKPPPPEPVPAADPLPDPGELQVEACIRQLTLKQKIGQRFITWVPGTEISARARRLIQDGCVAGIVLTVDNVKSREQLKRLTTELQALAAGNAPPIGLLIGIDQEGGRVSRIRLDGVTRFPPPYSWGQHDDPQYVEAAAYVLNREILDLGCNLNLAPVLDLYGPPDDAVIGDRSMGRDARQVGFFGLAWLNGARRAGVAAVAKHFPGHGATAVDSHRYLPVVDLDPEEMLRRDVLPFRMAMENGLEALMTAHILYPRLDPRYPATLSRPILQGLLRERLGFRGVIISDGIGMGALLNYFSVEDVLRGCLEAGVDLILEQSPYDTLRLEETVLKLVQQELVPETVIDEGLRRVLRWKLRCGLLPAGPLPDPAGRAPAD